MKNSIIFDLKTPWKYSDKNLTIKIVNFAREHHLEEIYVSVKVMSTLISRFSILYVGSLFNYINNNLVKIKTDKGDK